jgi:predicted nucleic acid-binding protein
VRRLVLDTGPLIALFSAQDDYHQVCKAGFAQLPTLFGEVVTPLPVVFEVYKFVARAQSPNTAQKALTVIVEDTLVIPLSMEAFWNVYSLSHQLPQWKGSLEDASVVVTAKHYNASVWTLDYRDLSWFKELELWTP